MKKLSIKYYAENSSMGDNGETFCNAYRAWALEELQREFPNHRVEVLNEPSLRTSNTDDGENMEEINDFCHELWDRQQIFGYVPVQVNR